VHATFKSHAGSPNRFDVVGGQSPKSTLNSAAHWIPLSSQSASAPDTPLDESSLAESRVDVLSAEVGPVPVVETSAVECVDALTAVSASVLMSSTLAPSLGEQPSRRKSARPVRLKCQGSCEFAIVSRRRWKSVSLRARRVKAHKD
jgi:hypothetical protein